MSIKVLVADDSITIQKVIGIIFGGEEYSLTVVDNGKSAVEKAREINPDILLIDALMPGMTGYEVSEAVRSIPALANKPILILTGSFEPFDEDKAKKCGADDFIAKPFESQQIITKVKELLELGNSRTLSTQDMSSSPSPDSFFEQAVETPKPVLDTPAPVTVQQPVAPTNIWSAFTSEEAPQTEAEISPVIPDISVAQFEPDVFAMVTEENDVQLVQPSEAAHASPQHTGSQWVPVEEHTFEFVEETAPPQTIMAQSAPIEESAFGDIAFESEVPAPSTPAFADFSQPAPVFEVPAVPAAPVFEVPSEPAAPFVPLADPTPPVLASEEVVPAEPAITESAPVTLTEEQLKAAISSASKEVIERIVWEVVPDLAEALIREAIRKIKQGV